MLSNPEDEDMDDAPLVSGMTSWSSCGLALVDVWSIKVSSLHKVSGQYIPEGFYKGIETIMVYVLS